jgi:hypothetical protein
MIITLPTLTIALLIALLCGALYHLVRDGGGWYFLFYCVLSMLGFAAGQGVSAWRGWIVLQFGMLDVGMGVIGSFIFLVIGEWLSKIDVKNENESGV